MTKSIIAFLILFSAQSSVFAQINFSVSGFVIDNKTQEPIPFANVFLEGSTLGTQTDESGYFIIRKVPNGFYKVVASFVGYSSKVISLEIADANKEINFMMSEDVKFLKEVDVIGSRDKEWERRYKDFEKAFLGAKSNKKEVNILNPEIIDFSKINGVLKAKSNKEIIVKNESLGYQITYSLSDFNLNNTTTSFTGLAKYEELTTTKSKQQDKWQKSRADSYYGSLRHFLKALKDNKLEQEGFEAYFLNVNYVNTSGKKDLFYSISNGRHSKLNPEKIIKKLSSTTYTLSSDKPIEVIYNKKRINHSVFPDAPHPYSILIKKSKVIFSENGSLENPFSLELKGDMGEPGLANWLPVNYVPESEDKFDRKDPSMVLQRNFEVIVARDKMQKVFVATEKSVYDISDSLIFLAKVVDAYSNLPLHESQKLFVELQNGDKQIVLNTILKTDINGSSKSFFLLPDSLSSGSYTLVAFTNWMRNFENPIVFQKQISINNNYQPEKVSAKLDESFNVAFFPEGGNLLYGIPTKIGFRVTAPNEKSTVGKLGDSSGKILQVSTCKELINNIY